VSSFAVRFLTEGPARKPAEKKNGSPTENNEDNEKRRTHTTAGHKLKRQLAPARRSAPLEFQRLDKDLNVHERPPALGSHFRIANTEKLRTDS
jgi:hypothetical protein